MVWIKATRKGKISRGFSVEGRSEKAYVVGSELSLKAEVLKVLLNLLSNQWSHHSESLSLPSVALED
jgi:hypothetical protein